MQQKAAEELVDRERQQFLFVVVGGIAPTKGDLSVSKLDQSMVGDGHAMGVTAQIAEHIFWASERTLCVDHPVLSEHWSEPRRKGSRLSEELQVSMKVELAVPKGTLECVVELAAEDGAKHLDGKKEIVAWLEPARPQNSLLNSPTLSCRNIRGNIPAAAFNLKTPTEVGTQSSGVYCRRPSRRRAGP